MKLSPVPGPLQNDSNSVLRIKSNCIPIDFVLKVGAVALVAIGVISAAYIAQCGFSENNCGFNAQDAWSSLEDIQALFR